MTTVASKKKRGRFHLFKAFRFHRKNKEEINEEDEHCEAQGIEPVEAYTPLELSSAKLDHRGASGGSSQSLSNPEGDNMVHSDCVDEDSVEIRRLMEPPNQFNVDNRTSGNLENGPQVEEAVNNYNYESQEAGLSEICDNARNEHIEDILLNEKVNGDSGSSDESDSLTENFDRSGKDSCQERKSQDVGRHVIPEGLAYDTLFVYTHVFVAVLLCSFSVVLGVAYAGIVVGICRSNRSDSLSSVVSKLSSAAADTGVSWHVVIWVLLASFGNFYIAMAYAFVILVYAVCVAVAEQIAQAIAQLLASLVFVLFLGPVFALLRAIFSPTATQQPYEGQGHRSNNKVNNIFEALFRFFLFPLYLPIKLQQYRRQHYTAPTRHRERPSRSCDLLRRLFASRKSSVSIIGQNSSATTWSAAGSQAPRTVSQRREKPSRGCDLCHRLFHNARSRKLQRSTIGNSGSGNFCQQPRPSMKL